MLNVISLCNLILRALANEHREGVQAALTEAFRQYGLPDRINTDNGAPGATAHKAD